METKTLAVFFFIIFVIAIPVVIITYFLGARHTAAGNGVASSDRNIKLTRGISGLAALIGVVGLQITCIDRVKFTDGIPLYLVISVMIGVIMIVIGHFIGPWQRRLSPDSRFHDREFNQAIESALRLGGAYIFGIAFFCYEIRFM